MNTTTGFLPDITTENILLAKETIIEFAKSKKLVLTGDLDITAKLTFTSKTQKKTFQHSLSRTINKPNRKSISFFLRHFAKFTGTKAVKLDYSEREKAIIQAKKDWKFLQSKAEEAMTKYKELKGSFYKWRIIF